MFNQLFDILLPVGIVAILISALSLYIFCIVDIHRQKVHHQSERSTWLNLIWMAPIIGCFIYLLSRKNIQQRAQSRF